MRSPRSTEEGGSDQAAVALGDFPRTVDRGPFRFFSGLAVPNARARVDSTTGLIGFAEAAYRNQAEAVYRSLHQLTTDVGGVGSLVRQHMYQRSKRQFPVLEDVRLQVEGNEPAPSSGVGMNLLRDDPSLTYEVDAIGQSPAGRERHGHRVILEDAAAGPPAAHYTQAVRVGPYIFLAGMIAIDPRTSQTVSGFADVPPEARWLQRGRSHPDSRLGPIVAQTWSLYSRVLAFLDLHGLSSDNVCQATLFVADPDDLADALRVHQRIFGAVGPALQVIAVDEVGHRGTLIEIECTASAEPVLRATGAQPFFAPHPDVCVSAELVTVSDHLGVDDNGELCTGLEGLTGVDPDHARGMQRLVESGGEATEALVAQLYAALRGVEDSLEAAGLQLAELGHILVRVHRQCEQRVVEPVLRLVLGAARPAVTVLSTHSIPQSEHALVAVAATGGRAASQDAEA